LEVALAIRLLIENERIHEKEPGGPGRPPKKRRDMLKCHLLLEMMGYPAEEFPGLYALCGDVLALKSAPPAPRTIRKYRADGGLTGTLERLVTASARELLPHEKFVAADASGFSRSVGKAWSANRKNPVMYRQYEKLHLLVGTKTLVILAARVTRGTWHDSPEFDAMVRMVVPGTGIRAVLADPGYVAVRNYEVVKECGATAYIRPKDNARFRPHPKNAYEGAVLYATRFPERWK
jgi:hypothetical protein